jgi:hypothetical protein
MSADITRAIGELDRKVRETAKYVNGKQGYKKADYLKSASAITARNKMISTRNILADNTNHLPYIR